MKISYVKQPVSLDVLLSSYGEFSRVICKNLTEELTEVQTKSFAEDGEQTVYYIHKKSALFSDPDWTLFTNIGESGIFISNLIKLKRWYTLDSIMNQIQQPDIRKWISEECYHFSYDNTTLHLQGPFLMVRLGKREKLHRYPQELTNLLLISKFIHQHIQDVVIDPSKLVPVNSRSTHIEMETTEEQLIKFGKKITLGVLIGTIGSIVLPNILEGILSNSGDISIDSGPRTNISFKCTRH